MTIDDWLQETTAKFKENKIESARLDALVLLEHVLQTSRATLLAHPEMPLPATTLVKLNSAQSQRLDGIPVAYIINKKEFYGRDYIVNEHVLIPRPETESLVDIAKKLVSDTPKILDIGTGSGCIAITLALEVPHSKLVATDVSDNALKIAKLNAKSLGAQVTFKKADLFTGLQHRSFDIVCANLPYVPDGLITSTEITKEPAQALFSGVDGLSHYHRLFAEIPDHKPKYILIEALLSQHDELKKLAAKVGYQLLETQGLILAFNLSN